MTPMMPNKILTESLTHGINDDILHRAAQYDPPPTDQSGDLLWFNPVTLAFVLDDLLAEAGGRVLFHTFISDAIVEDGALTGIVIENKSGRQQIEARVTIDCTGDADVALRAGVPCVSGDPEDGKNQPMSLRFALAGVDQERAAAFLADELGMACYARPPLFEIGAGEAKNTPLGPLICRGGCRRAFWPKTTWATCSFSPCWAGPANWPSTARALPACRPPMPGTCPRRRRSGVRRYAASPAFSRRMSRL